MGEKEYFSPIFYFKSTQKLKYKVQSNFMKIKSHFHNFLLLKIIRYLKNIQDIYLQTYLSQIFPTDKSIKKYLFKLTISKLFFLTDLPCSMNAILIRGQLTKSHRAPRVQFIGRNTDLRPHAKLTAIRKPR